MLAAPALAQAPPPQPGVIERTAPAEPPRLGPALLPPEPARRTGPGESHQVPLARATVTGSTALPQATLRAALSPLQGGPVTLGEIETARLAVLQAYRAAGMPYVAVAARLAPLPDGFAELQLQVTEGFIAEVTLDGEAGPATRQAMRFLQGLQGERPLRHAALERALLLASDIPGLTAQGVLRPLPGEPGALQLVVRLARRPVSGFLNLDNRGYRLTGAWQALLLAQLNSFTRFGERTEFAALQSDANGQSFIQVTEEAFLGGSGLRWRAWAGAGRAAPGSELAAIGYAGQTRVAGIGLAYPLVRSRPATVTLSGALDAFESVVEARLAPGMPRERQSRDAVRAFRFGVELAAQDAVLAWAPAAASTIATLRLHQGIEAFGASEGSSGTTARAGSDFGFRRVTLEAARLQPLLVPGDGWLISVQGQAGAQWTDDILPPAEKFYLGGTRLGRGFYAGQVTGDRALAGSVELQAGRQFRLDLGTGETLGIGAQLYLFRDEGRSWDNGPGGIERAVASWGGGLRLQFEESVQLDLEAVRRLTRRPEGAGVTPLEENAIYARLLLRY